jgi:hypothetical protein
LEVFEVNNMMRKTGIAALIALLLSASAVYAESQQCYVDQYVMNRSAVPAKRQKAVDNLERISAQALELTNETSSAMLIESRSMVLRRKRRGVDPEGPEKENYSRKHLCEQFERFKRRERRRGKIWAMRRQHCDCNGVLTAREIPNDKYFNLQWGFHQDNGGGLNVDMNMPEAWDIWKGTRSTVVAVIDTGVDYNHPDLADNIWVNEAEKYGQPGVDDDGNGWVDDIHGVNAISNTSSPGNPIDDNGHGTHVAGTIGAVGNNGAGVAGVNQQISIVGVKFLSSSGSGSLYDAVRAIDYTTDLKVKQGVNLILTNNSWGGSSGFYALENAIRRAGDHGILFVAAAGNSGKNIDYAAAYPAGYSLGNIVSVAAIDSSGRLASFSNYGTKKVDIAAPGVQIASTYPGGGYRYLQGTSMASPHVAGALALLSSRAPSLGAEELKSILYSTGQVLPSLVGVIATGKTVDMLAMLKAADALPEPEPGEPNPTPTPPGPQPPTPTPTPTPEPTPTPQPTPGVFDLAGTVVLSTTQQPVPGVRIEFKKEGGETEVRFTGSDGRFQYDDIDGPVVYTLQAVKTGTQSVLVSGTLKSDEDFTLSLVPHSVALTGYVRDPNNIPIRGITVNAGDLGSVITDDNGKFEFTTRFGEPYELRFIHPLYTFPYGVAKGVAWGQHVRISVAEKQ